MNVSSQKNLGPVETTPDQGHPAWCDRAGCTANPASQANGYRAGVGGEHRSAPLRLDLSCAFPLPKPAGEAYLTEAVAPWPCSTYLRIRVGDAEVSISVERAAPVLSALHMLVAAGEEVTPR
ncbi:hypothetical protein [Micromonospora sp. WMMD1082]|uniref:hypothetical protein n=1 Tax=Micromonospora sp. WMMD1082 TaxID=3016104 RepID=UPI0024159D34|nr:hypothetical protein [Micromonospora sp. WMMD1082]MDG4798831.1 hypothetical protein [Micromonospora sp. WMMD1082]